MSLSVNQQLLNPSAIEAEGWRPVMSGKINIPAGSKVYEKDLGLLVRVWDLAKRVLLCCCFESKGSLDKATIFNSFDVPKFWSGKRLYTVKDTSLKQKSAQTDPLPPPSSLDVEDQSGPTKCFLEQVSKKWIVRDPDEPNREFKANPQKTDATSRLQVNLMNAREQQAQILKENFPMSDEERQAEINKFLEKFDEEYAVVPVRQKVNSKGWLYCQVKTEWGEWGSKVCHLQDYSYAISSTQGRRPNMEDAHAVFELDGHPCFAVFDGNGGKEVAEYCAENTQRILEKYLREGQGKNKKPLNKLSDAELLLFFKKGFILLDAAAKNAKGVNSLASTTAILNVVIGDRIICVNLGDSRTVVINKESEVIQISSDQEPNNPKYSKKILSNGGEIHWDKVYGSLAVPRNIGSSGDVFSQCVSPVPTLSEYTIGKYMIIACDGLWDVMSSEDAGELLAQMEKKRRYDVDAMSQALIKFAFTRYPDNFDKNAEDNMTVIVVKTKV